ncbi:uncharacterized protein LOC8264869 isoform X2 [Ricinus communis]|uniref:uncharacterized protein LOC8264869 isoform X2 n=1 Tax=Ricinus communis TaxID=3988 RepID=UPI00201B0758|nr:uncharacterized protein LOC8264869 isoform X2 [Ricinus communis]
MIDTEPERLSIDESASMFLYSHAEVDQDLCYFTTFEDEVTGLQHYLPECDGDCFNCPVGFEAFNSLGGFSIESFSCAIEYDQIKFDGDALDLYLAHEEKTKEDNNRMQGTDKKVPLGDFSLLSTCQESVLGAEAAVTDSNLNCNAREDSCLENVPLESHSSCSRKGERDIELVDASSRAMVFECPCDKNSLLLDKMTAQDLRQVFSGMFGRETSVLDRQWLKRHILFGLQNQGEIVNGLNLLDCGKTSKADEGETVILSSKSSSRSAPDSTDISDDQFIEKNHVKREKFYGCNSLESASSPVREIKFASVDETNIANILVTRKRTYRPTRIWTKGLQEQKSRYHSRKWGASTKNARKDSLLARSHKQHHQKGIGVAHLVFQKESLEGSCIPVPFDLRVQEGQSMKNTSLVNDFDGCNDNRASVSTEDLDMETSLADSEKDISQSDCATRIKKARKQRRRHRRWTPSEVMKLVDGVSKYGVGKWTHIKKLLFSSSSYRTSVNLKDKWRNLLKASRNDMQKKRKRDEEGMCREASCNNMHKKRKIEHRETQASYQLPESVWNQIRELAVIYSYPGESKSNVS